MALDPIEVFPSLTGTVEGNGAAGVSVVSSPKRHRQVFISLRIKKFLYLVEFFPLSLYIITSSSLSHPQFSVPIDISYSIGFRSKIMGSNQPDYGRRLLPVLVDEISRDDPDRIFISLPLTSNPEDGFRDISYRSFANAINRAAWWLESKLGKGQNFETLAYTAPSDIRYPIIAYAAIKAGYKVSKTTLRLVLVFGNAYLSQSLGLVHLEPQQRRG